MKVASFCFVLLFFFVSRHGKKFGAPVAPRGNAVVLNRRPYAYDDSSFILGTLRSHSVGRVRYQSFVTATVRERSQRTDGLVLLRSLLWDRSVPTYKRATPYRFKATAALKPW